MGETSFSRIHTGCHVSRIHTGCHGMPWHGIHTGCHGMSWHGIHTGCHVSFSRIHTGCHVDVEVHGCDAVAATLTQRHAPDVTAVVTGDIGMEALIDCLAFLQSALL